MIACSSSSSDTNIDTPSFFSSSTSSFSFRGCPEMSSSKYGHFQIYIPTHLIIFRRCGIKLHMKFSEPHHFENLHTYPCDELISGRPLSQSSFPTRETSDSLPKFEEIIPPLPIFF